MKRTIASILLAIAAAAALPLSVHAHAVPEAGRTGTITVNMRYAGKPICDGELALYRVGAVTEDDGNFSFTKTGSFTAWEGEFDDLTHGAELARSLERFVKEHEITGIREPVRDGAAKFGSDGAGLEQGLYLVIQTVPAAGYSAVAPFLISLPYFDGSDYQYDVRADAKNELEKIPETVPPTEPPGNLPQTGQLWWPVPVLICAGLSCMAVGLICRRRDHDEA